MLRKKIFVLLILTLSMTIFTSCGEEKNNSITAETLKVEDWADYFQDQLKTEEFIGYTAAGQYQGENYLYGLAYENPQGDYVNTSLEALIILKKQNEGNYEKIKRCKIPSENTAGFELPVGTGENYNFQVFNMAGNILLQTVEPTFSDFPVIHQILVNDQDCLDFHEATQGDGVIFLREGNYYTQIDDYWQCLEIKDNAINYKIAQVEDMRPQIGENDTVISYLYRDTTAANPEFQINGEEAPVLLTEYSGTLRDTIEVKAGDKIYFYETAAYPLTLQKDSIVNGEYREEPLPIEKGIGYKILDTQNLTGKISVFLGYYADFWYEIPINITAP